MLFCLSHLAPNLASPPLENKQHVASYRSSSHLPFFPPPTHNSIPTNIIYLEDKRRVAQRPRLDLCHVDLPQRKDRERVEELSGSLAERKHDARLVRLVVTPVVQVGVPVETNEASKMVCGS